MKTTIKLICLLGILIFASCSKNDDSLDVLPEVNLKSSAKQITGFEFNTSNNNGLSEKITASIDEANKTISALVPYGADLTSFTPTTTVSDKANITPTGAQDFSSPVIYTITAEDNTKSTYTATITTAPNTEKAILSFQFLLSENPFDINIIAEIDEENKRITFNVPDGADISALLPTIQTSNDASISPQGLQNFEETVTYKITAQDGSTTEYEVRATLSQRAVLIAIYNESPGNTLGWDIESTDIGNWQGVTIDIDGHVTGLNLSDKNIEYLSPKVGLLDHLTLLAIARTPLKYIPKEVGSLINLTYLNLVQTEISKLPEEIGNLNELKVLSLSKGNLSTLTTQIGTLVNLEHLALGNNQLTQIPLEIGNLSKLVSLELTNNPLTQLPPEIGNLSSLVSLSLNGLESVQLPPEIGNLTSLVFLGLARNDLIEIPPEIGNLSDLTNLDLSNNQLTKIPPEIGNLTNLNYLSLNNNQLTEIPSEIGNLTNLVTLNLLDNQLTIIPFAVCQLQPLHGTDLQVDPEVFCTSSSSKI
ncbi:leucine-rich repeat domain-containing protein [Maribacter sp. 2307UL18-2]|uniref:leucine-rich repeat domain-containing protein n=1 Tax=Maribacter sp. 2307UL18-2 TaxID=3386274 RepID=UPI0039BD2C27